LKQDLKENPKQNSRFIAKSTTPKKNIDLNWQEH